MTSDLPSPVPQHGTLVLGGSFEVPADRLYAAVSDPLERALVGTLGGDHVMLIDESDFRIGGREFYRFGLKGAPALSAKAIFHQIVPRSLVVATEIVHSGNICVSFELVTLVLAERDRVTDLTLTAQSLSLCADDDLSDAASARHQAFIEALGRHLGVFSRDQSYPFPRR
jgi:uncharacterized protein YndB with AHSA1/START domain